MEKTQSHDMVRAFENLKQQTEDKMSHEICAGLVDIANDLNEVFARLNEIEKKL